MVEALLFREKYKCYYEKQIAQLGERSTEADGVIERHGFESRTVSFLFELR